VHRRNFTCRLTFNICWIIIADMGGGGLGGEVTTMEKHTAIRMLPGSRVVFRGMLHEVVSIKSAGGMDGPYFRLRNLEHGTPTDLVSYKFLEPARLRDRPV
jgi:hypothetical protein